jgi:manganese/zinc/iron transport system permease protein
VNWIWELDGWIVLAAMLCSVAAALPGNFLVLRRMSLLGDAISHAVLPGLAAAFLVVGSRDSVPMFLGAVAVGLVTSFAATWLHRAGRVDEGAALGVVFTGLFALGLVMIVAAADRVDLDPNCVLYGAIELTPLQGVDLGGLWVPRVVIILSIVLLLNATVIGLRYKELKLTSFDAQLATVQGIRASRLHYLLMALVAITAVASFEAVGNILVVAMFVVPPATAYLLTDRLHRMIGLSALVAIASAVIGHLAAIEGPRWLGLKSTATSGAIATVSGLLFCLAWGFAPKQGVVPRWLRQLQLQRRTLREDVLAFLYRREERMESPEAVRPFPSLTVDQMAHPLVASPASTLKALRSLLRSGQIESDGAIGAGSMLGQVRLTAEGKRMAATLVRSHRLWEQYLVAEAGVDATAAHAPAERLEHVTDADLRARLDASTSSPSVDPHGKPLPPEPM